MHDPLLPAQFSHIWSILTFFKRLHILTVQICPILHVRPFDRESVNRILVLGYAMLLIISMLRGRWFYEFPIGSHGISCRVSNGCPEPAVVSWKVSCCVGLA